MVTTRVRTADTNTFDAKIVQQIADIQRIARSLKRWEIAVRYSHGTIKRSAMAMINQYIRQASKRFSSDELHIAM